LDKYLKGEDSARVIGSKEKLKFSLLKDKLLNGEIKMNFKS
jgi:hypothetical protein